MAKYISLIPIVVALCLATANGLLYEWDTDARNAIERYRAAAQSILNYHADGEGATQPHDRLALLCDLYGARMAGGQQLEDAIDYLKEAIEHETLELLDNDNNPIIVNIHKELVQVTKWERISEKATLKSPTINLSNGESKERDIAILGSGYSISTEGEIEGELVIVESIEELENLPASEIPNGNFIVLFNQPWEGIGYSSGVRVAGPEAAARRGAIASLTRSLGEDSYYTPHTGTHVWEDDSVNQIPAACITKEDSEMFARMKSRGEEIRISLDLQYTDRTLVDSYNLVAEIRGSEFPEEVVFFGGHIDSWDVGQGAMDDGGGVIISWQVLTTIANLMVSGDIERPRRTMRMVLWTAEEHENSPGAEEYYRQHGGEDDIDNFVMVMESDSGTFAPLGLEYSGSDRGEAFIEDIIQALEPIGATAIVREAFGVDIIPWQEDGGRSAFSLHNDNGRYFDYHHTDGDTMSVQTPENLAGCSVVWTLGAYVAADYEDRSIWYEGGQPEQTSSAVINTPCSVFALSLVTLLVFFRL